MIQIAPAASFTRAYGKRVRGDADLEAKFARALAQFVADPHAPRLQTHKLSGELAGLWSFTVAYDCRVVFRFSDPQHAVLVDIGTHDEVY